MANTPGLPLKADYPEAVEAMGVRFPPISCQCNNGVIFWNAEPGGNHKDPAILVFHNAPKDRANTRGSFEHAIHPAKQSHSPFCGSESRTEARCQVPKTTKDRGAADPSAAGLHQRPCRRSFHLPWQPSSIWRLVFPNPGCTLESPGEFKRSRGLGPTTRNSYVIGLGYGRGILSCRPDLEIP